MVTATFELGRLPRVLFGAGTLGRVPDLAAEHGRRALLVTGAQSLDRSPHWAELEAGLRRRGVAAVRVRVADEPSPELVDRTVAEHRDAAIDVVIGVGGGSALDVAKAVAGLLRTRHSVLDYLEGVGRGRRYRGPAVPWIGVPTTAGTGSEATKNAVLGTRGEAGYKKSFRDERLVARYAVVDPRLLESCSQALIAADGMDALTQLIESYVSVRSNTLTQALAESGLRAVRDGLLAWYGGTTDLTEVCPQMAYAALVSGIVLAQTGLGVVHGLASPLGALFTAPHGAICGSLLAVATEVNIDALRERAPHDPALRRYTRIAELLVAPGATHERLVATLREWTEALDLPRLGRYGVQRRDLPRIVARSRGSSMTTNPIPLSDDEVGAVVSQRL